MRIYDPLSVCDGIPHLPAGFCVVADVALPHIVDGVVCVGGCGGPQLVDLLAQHDPTSLHHQEVLGVSTSQLIVIYCRLQ